MKRQLLFSIIFQVFVFSQISAQNVSLYGNIIDQNNKEPLPAASVALYVTQDSTLISGTVTDTTGAFKLEHLSRGNFFLIASFIGFLNDTIAPILLTDHNVDLGIIELKATTLLLEDVRITSGMPVMTNELDKKVYHVDKDILAETSSVSEILQNIPSVTVDINGGITLRNTSNITFFLNGKPSALLRRNASAVLQQIPASSIKQIEIITNPSAKYRPDGVGGIINIVLKKEKTKGLNGQASVQGGNEYRYNAGLNLNYGMERLKLYGNYELRHSDSKVLYTDNRVYKDSLTRQPAGTYSENGYSRTNALAHNILAGLNYELNDQNSLEVSGSYFQQNSLHHSFSGIHSCDSLKVPVTSLSNHSTNNECEKERELNFTLDHQFGNNEDHNLSIDATYAGYDEQEDKNVNQTYLIPADNYRISHYLIRKSGHQQEISVEYNLPTGSDAESNFGYAGEFIFDNIRYNNDQGRNQFLFNQEVHALYALYGQSFDHFDLKAGLRGEAAFLRSHLVIPFDSLVHQRYYKLFPTLHLGYSLSEKEEFSLGYSKRLNRPDADGLNPNPEFSDPWNAEAGNPDLKPEQIHAIELGYTYNGKQISVTSSLYYRYKYDAFTSTFHNLADSIVLVTTSNLNTRRSGGVEGTLSGTLFKKWDYQLSADVFYTTIDASDLGYSANKSAVSGNLKVYSLIRFVSQSYFQLNGYYYFPSINPQGRRESFYYLNFGLKQNLFRNKASLTFTATDFIHTYKIRYTIDSATLTQATSIQRQHPVFYLGFIWRFNNNDKKDKKELDFEGEGLVK